MKKAFLPFLMTLIFSTVALAAGSGHWITDADKTYLLLEGRVFEIPDSAIGLKKDKTLAFVEEARPLHLQGEIATEVFLHLWDFYANEQSLPTRTYAESQRLRHVIDARGIICIRYMAKNEVDESFWLQEEAELVPKVEGSKFECFGRLIDDGTTKGSQTALAIGNGRFTVTNGGGSDSRVSKYDRGDAIRNEVLVKKYFNDQYRQQLIQPGIQQ